MIAIVCIDDNKGISFNNRRQSRDKMIYEKICSIVAGSRLKMTHSSYELFENGDLIEKNKINIIMDDILDEKNLDKKDFVFFEDDRINNVEKSIDKLIIFNWNRLYPADIFFEIDLNEQSWILEKTEEFQGNSHEKIRCDFFIRKDI